MLAFLLALLGTANAFASTDWGFLPDSRHQLYESYGLFLDDHSALLYGSAGRTFEMAGWAVPVFGDDSSESHPQLLFDGLIVIGGSANSDLRISAITVDGGFGLAWEQALSSSLRFSVGLYHLSGHSADGLPPQDVDLATERPLYESIPLRLVHDRDLGDAKLRVGATLRPILRSSPDLYPIMADQFAEIFPFGIAADGRAPRPFLSASLDERGLHDSSYKLSFHLQAGVAIGNHFQARHTASGRFAIGYYNGADPRMKYFEFRDQRAEFVYLGFLFNI